MNGPSRFVSRATRLLHVMSGIGSWIWGTSQIDEAIDRATSELIPGGSEDIALNLEICDQIRSKAVAPKDACKALKRRLNHKNPNVQLLALSLTDICVKNGGDHFLTEVGSRDFMDNLVSILKMPALNSDVKQRILRYVQDWAAAADSKAALVNVVQVYKTLKSEGEAIIAKQFPSCMLSTLPGFTFPPRDSSTSAAMVDTQTAPEWIDSDVCLRCRTPFTFTNRKHHCRNCGQVFDGQCSTKSIPLPHYGIAQPVRVCDACYTKVVNASVGYSTTPKPSYSPTRSSSKRSRGRHSRRDFDDAELQRAIQLSLQEVGASTQARYEPSEPPLVVRSAPSRSAVEEHDPDLLAAIQASLLESQAPQASAPLSTPRTESPPPVLPRSSSRYESVSTFDLDPLEEDAILTFSQTVEHLQNSGSGARDMARFPALAGLLDKASALRPKLAMGLEDADGKASRLKEMHEKLGAAVRLYDGLLTEQVSRPPISSWQRAPSHQQQGQYSGYQSNWSQYAQSPAAQHTYTGASQESHPMVNGYQPSYAQPDPRSNYQVPYAAPPPRQEPQQTYQTPIHHPTHLSSPPPIPNWTHHPQYVRDTQQTPVPQIIPAQVTGPPPQPQTTHEWAPQQVAYAPPSQQPAVSPTLSLQRRWSQVPDTYSAPPLQPAAPPPVPPQSVPLQPSQFSTDPSLPISPSALSPASLSGLSRHDTTIASPAAPANSGLQRASTISGSYAPTASSYGPRHSPVQYTQPPLVQAPPVFPVVPSADPVYFPAHGPSVPSWEQSERKEPVLIDL